MDARATWKGVLQLVQLSIPVKVYPATEAAGGLSFNQLHEPCGTRIQQRKWCPTCALEVPAPAIVKGFEFARGRYVQILAEEFDAVKPPSTRTIVVTQCAPTSQLPRRAIDRAYALAPDGPYDGPAARAYAVLVQALAEAVAIGTVALYGREYLVAIAAEGGLLLLYTLHHAAELRALDHAKATLPPVVPRDYVTLARQLIEALTRPLDLASFQDAYQRDLERLIAAKISGEEIVAPPTPEAPPALPLEEALRASLVSAVSAGKKRPAKVRKAS